MNHCQEVFVYFIGICACILGFSDVRMADRNIAITQKSIPTLALNRSKVTVFRRWLVEIKHSLYAHKKERKKRKEKMKERKKKKERRIQRHSLVLTA